MVNWTFDRIKLTRVPLWNAGNSYTRTGIITMKTCRMFISREQYNKLVERFPAFMSVDWPKFERNWVLAGCEVSTQNAGLFHALKTNLKMV